MDVPTVPISDLHSRLGFADSLDYPESSLNKALTDWRMAEDDAPIFRYLYRNFMPQRHLEFGTWLGTGALFCLEECDATVWTINLLHGELLPDGTWAYHSEEAPERRPLVTRVFSKLLKTYALISFRKEGATPVGDSDSAQTDSLGSIGKCYLDANLGHRVCQIYCDSLKWDIRNYPAGFFDTALIDGGHSEEVVVSDTLKALQLVRSGGLILWHDFCPNSDVMVHCSSTAGVLKAIESKWHWLRAQTQDLFWINPSWILVGIKR